MIKTTLHKAKIAPCCFCFEPTNFYQEKKDMPCCINCVSTHKVKDLPTKSKYLALVSIHDYPKCAGCHKTIINTGSYSGMETQRQRLTGAGLCGGVDFVFASSHYHWLCQQCSDSVDHLIVALFECQDPEKRVELFKHAVKALVSDMALR